MAVHSCPISIIHAPIDAVWPLLSEPANYASWWDAKTVSIVPAGYAHRGQRILAKSNGFRIEIVVIGYDESRGTLDLTTKLPFGITTENHIVCRAVDDQSCQVTFG